MCDTSRKYWIIIPKSSRNGHHLSNASSQRISRDTSLCIAVAEEQRKFGIPDSPEKDNQAGLQVVKPQPLYRDPPVNKECRDHLMLRGAQPNEVWIATVAGLTGAGTLRQLADMHHMQACNP